MKKILVSLALGTALVSVPALAQEASDKAFQGPRVEGVIGYDTTRAGTSNDVDPNSPNRRSIDGLLYGVGAGYDVRAGNLVFGPEAEVTWSTAKSKFDDGQFENFGAGDVSTNRDLYLGARVGYTITPTTMVYAKGGYTNAKFNIRNRFSGVDTNRDLDTDGWRVGAGVEHQFSRQVYGKVEYRYSNYKKGEVDYTGDAPDGQRFNVDFDRHQVAAAVGVRF